MLYGSLEQPCDPAAGRLLHGALRATHTVLALLLFATFLHRLAAALMHALIFRDGVLQSMASVSTGTAGPGNFTGRVQDR